MTGELCAWHYATRQPVRCCWQNGKLSHVEPASFQLDPRVWIAPALIDLQVNGYAGVDFQRDDLREEDLLHALAGLRQAGCARFLLTLMTNDWPHMISQVRQLRKLRARCPALEQAIAGWHFEGPFLSAEPGFCGAHNPAAMLDPQPEHFQELREATEQDPVLVTLAPERAGALAAIAQATAFGMTISLGHTNASASVLREAVAAGATGFTHLGNACPQGLDRHDNILWRALDTPGLTVSLIPDRIHVSPALFRILHRLLARESIYYTTDAVAAAGARPGQYTVGRLTVEVGPDGIVRQPGRTNYAGSALAPIDAIFRASAMTGLAWQDLWPCLSVHPARFMGWDDPFRMGQPAHFCVVHLDERGDLAQVQTFVGGRAV
jgi:N-acetylglucosamine-6-phosphate deacetylase